MEKLKVKHDHTLTDIIKVGIFAIFLLLPILIFAPTAFYYGFNEHAANETTTQVDIQYKYESNEVNNVDDLIVGNIYHFDSFSMRSYQESELYFDIGILKYDTIENLDFDGSNLDEVYFELNYNSLNSYIAYNYSDGSAYINFTSFETYSYVTFDYCYFDLTNVELLITNGLNDFKEYCEFFNYSPSISDFNVIESVDVQTDVSQSITQQMYNAWQNTWESALFNWTGNNNFAFTINAMSNVFGISQNSYIANYINYLLTLTAIYVIFDIVIAVFVKLTHMFHE